MDPGIQIASVLIIFAMLFAATALLGGAHAPRKKKRDLNKWPKK